MVRAVIACSLLVFQGHLLWVAELHRHETEESLPLRTASLREGRQRPFPALEAGLFCTACQIVRHSAVRPAASALEPKPASSITFRPAVPPTGLYSHQPAVAYGRAPPLL